MITELTLFNELVATLEVLARTSNSPDIQVQTVTRLKQLLSFELEVVDQWEETVIIDVSDPKPKYRRSA